MSEHVKTENESDTLEVQSVLWHEKHEQIKWQRARIAVLEAQLAEARKDSERLDAMIKGRWAIHTTWGNPTKYMVCKEGGYGPALCAPSLDAREAIDAAIEAVGKEGE